MSLLLSGLACCQSPRRSPLQFAGSCEPNRATLTPDSQPRRFGRPDPLIATIADSVPFREPKGSCAWRSRGRGDCVHRTTYPIASGASWRGDDPRPRPTSVRASPRPEPHILRVGGNHNLPSRTIGHLQGAMSSYGLRHPHA